MDGSINNLDAADSGLKDLEDCPTIKKRIRIDGTPITSLKGISPEIQELAMFFCKQLTAIDAPMPNVTKISAAGCSFKTLKDIHKFCPKLEDLQINACPIESHILGLLKIASLKPNVLGGRSGNQHFIGDDRNLMDRQDQAWKIVQHHLQSPPGNKRVIECQSDLLDAGLDEYAQL